jgi:hypothetical protein
MDGKYFVVTNHNVISSIKSSSKYFRVNLGVSLTLEDTKGEDRLDNDKDRFAFAYRKYKGSICLSAGEVGNMHFYTDHTMSPNKILIYKDFEEFELNYDTQYVKEFGTDAWIGKIMKEVDTKIEQLNAVSDELSTDVPNPVKNKGDRSKVFTNPGQVRYEDLKEYLASKRQKI